MLVPLLVFALVGCIGLFAALRPEEYARYFLAESQRRALSSNLKALSLIGWVIFVGCMVVIVAIPFQSKWNLLAPVFGSLFFLVCAVAYVWWGIGLPAQSRIISHANNQTLEPRSRVASQVLRFTTSAWRGRIFVRLRGKNQEFIAIAGEISPLHQRPGCENHRLIASLIPAFLPDRD
jgi:hypothetical protein